MLNLSIHRKVVGHVQLTTLVYDKEVFNLIVKKLHSSKLFQSVGVQIINHHSEEFNKSICNCNDILTYIAKEFRFDTERFAQVFVPLIIVDGVFNQRQHLLCELNFMHDNLIRSRKDFFVDDVQQDHLLSGYSKKKRDKSHLTKNCVFDLNEIMQLKKKDSGDINTSSRPDENINLEENYNSLQKVLKTLLLKDLLPISSKCLPMDSVNLQKVFDICYEHNLPDDMIVGIVNNLRKTPKCSNESNNCNGDLKTIPDCEFSQQSPDNKSPTQFTNNSAGRISDLETLKQVNISNNSRLPSRSMISQMKNRTTKKSTGLQSEDRTSYFPSDVNHWTSMHHYEPVSIRKQTQPPMASFHPTIASNRTTNRPLPKSVKFSSDMTQNRRRHPTIRDNNVNVEDQDENPFEVVIDDECHDLDNVEAITVRDSEGNSKVYVECESLPENNQRQSSMIRNNSIKIGNKISGVRKLNKKVEFLSNNEEDFSKCGSTALTRAVLGQEANSMDSLLSILNTRVQRDGDSQCMKLSMKAEHIIRKPECSTDGGYLDNQDGCLTVSSDIQAKWENCICNANEDVLPNDLYKNQFLENHPGIMSQDKAASQAKLISYRPTAIIANEPSTKKNLTYQEISNLCDKAIQTEKFMLIETDNERIVISPNSFYPKNITSPRPSETFLKHPASHEGSIMNDYNVAEPNISFDPVSNEYFYEDGNKAPNPIYDPNVYEQKPRTLRRTQFINTKCLPQQPYYGESNQEIINKNRGLCSSASNRELDSHNRVVGTDNFGRSVIDNGRSFMVEPLQPQFMDRGGAFNSEHFAPTISQNGQGFYSEHVGPSQGYDGRDLGTETGGQSIGANSRVYFNESIKPPFTRNSRGYINDLHIKSLSRSAFNESVRGPLAKNSQGFINESTGERLSNKSRSLANESVGHPLSYNGGGRSLANESVGQPLSYNDGGRSFANESVGRPLSYNSMGLISEHHIPPQGYNGSVANESLSRHVSSSSRRIIVEPNAMISDLNSTQNHFVADTPRYDDQSQIQSLYLSGQPLNNNFHQQSYLGPYNNVQSINGVQISSRSAHGYGESAHKMNHLPIEYQSNYSSSAPNFVPRKQDSSPDEYLYVEPCRISPVIDIQTGFKHSTGNNAVKPNQKLANIYIKHPSENLCRYHKFSGTNQRNNSSLMSCKTLNELCKYYSKDVISIQLLSEINNALGILNALNRKSRNIDELNDCGCYKNMIISILASLRFLDETKASCKKININLKNIQKEISDQSNFVNIFPGILDIVTKLHCKNVDEEYEKIIELLDGNLENKDDNLLSIIKGRKIMKRLKAGLCEIDDWYLDLIIDVAKMLHIDFSGRYSEIEVDCGP